MHAQAHKQVYVYDLSRAQNHSIFTFCFVIIIYFREEKFFIERFFIEDYMQEI